MGGDDLFQNPRFTLLYASKTGLMASWTSAAKSGKENDLSTKEREEYDNRIFQTNQSASMTYGSRLRISL